MKNPIVWLRISYWTGAIVDAKAALIMFFPNLIPLLYSALSGVTGNNQAFIGDTYRILAGLMVFHGLAYCYGLTVNLWKEKE